jgi:hypothetical protein
MKNAICFEFFFTFYSRYKCLCCFIYIVRHYKLTTTTTKTYGQ